MKEVQIIREQLTMWMILSVSAMVVEAGEDTSRNTAPGHWVAMHREQVTIWYKKYLHRGKGEKVRELKKID